METNLFLKSIQGDTGYRSLYFTANEMEAVYGEGSNPNPHTEKIADTEYLDLKLMFIIKHSTFLF